MDEWRQFFDSAGVDIFSVIQHAIAVAHTDHFDELRKRRDGFAERMFAPPVVSPKSSDESVSRTKAVSGVYQKNLDNEDVADEPRREVKHSRGVGRLDDETENEIIICSEEEDEPEEDVDEQHDVFDEEVEALEIDDHEREQLLRNEIKAIKDMVSGEYLGEAEALDVLFRVKQLNISVELLKVTNIGKSINRYRKHPSKIVSTKVKEIVSSWKVLVDEYYESVSASAIEEVAPVCDDEVGLPSPPIDEGDLLAARTVDVAEFFNFTDDDLSAASGPSPPTSDGPSTSGALAHRQTRDNRADYHHRERHSSSLDEEQDARGSKAAGRVHKVEKHRPIPVERKVDQNSRNATNNSSTIRKESTVPSGVKPTSVMKAATGSRKPGSASVPLKQSSAGEMKKPDARPTPIVGKPGLSTRPKPATGVVSDEEKLEASKRRLHSNYLMHDIAKRQRTTQSLELFELPKGGPKAQKPGQRGGWVNGRK